MTLRWIFYSFCCIFARIKDSPRPSLLSRPLQLATTAHYILKCFATIFWSSDLRSMLLGNEQVCRHKHKSAALTKWKRTLASHKFARMRFCSDFHAFYCTSFSNFNVKLMAARILLAKSGWLTSEGRKEVVNEGRWFAWRTMKSTWAAIRARSTDDRRNMSFAKNITCPINIRRVNWNPLEPPGLWI